jgi:hypothetical protein
MCRIKSDYLAVVDYPIAIIVVTIIGINRDYWKKNYQFQVSVKDDNYDACKTANITISGRQNLAKWALTCYGGSTHERLLSKSIRPYMLAYYLFLYVLLLCIGGEVITIGISFNLMSGRESIML